MNFHDMGDASLTLGTKIVLPNSESQGKDSVDLIPDPVFQLGQRRGSCCNMATRMGKHWG